MNGNNFSNSGMDDDSFNVFNQNAEAYQQQQELLRQQAAQQQQVAQQQEQALAQAHEQQKLTPTLTTEKKSFFAKLMEKKPKKEERVFDINDPSTYVREEKEHKEIDEKQKNKLELLLLLVLVIVLGAVGYWAFTVFKDTMGFNNKIDTNPSPIHSSESDVIFGYACTNSISNTLYINVPFIDRIDNNLSQTTISYFADGDNIYSKEEKFVINYVSLDKDSEKIVRDFCNSYNLVNDSYQVVCDLSYSVMTITNRFDINKIEGTVTNGDIVYDIGVNSGSILKDVVNDKSASGYVCTPIFENK